MDTISMLESKPVFFQSKKKHSTGSTNLTMSRLNPATSGNSSVSDMKSFAINGKVYSHLDLASLTLYQVAREGDVLLMEKLLERMPNPQLRKKKLNARDEAKLAPIHYAARYNHYDMLKFLINQGTNVQIKGEDDATAMHYLAKYKKKSAHVPGENEELDLDEDLTNEKSPSCLRLLHDNGANVNAQDVMGLTPLHQACTRKNMKAVRELLLFSDLQIESADHQGMTALHLSCLYGRKVIVKMLLGAGANLGCRDRDLTTPLHLCCAEGSIEIAELLLDKADSAAQEGNKELPAYNTINETSKINHNGSKHNSNNGVNPLKELNRRNTNSSLLKVKSTTPTGGAIDLLQYTDGDKNFPVHLAIENGHLELVQLCIDRGKKAGVNDMVYHSRSQGDSSLHLAVQANNLNIVKLLLKEGVHINARNSLLVTPLMLSCQHNAHHIAKYLLENGADVELKDIDYMTPLMIACRFGHFEAIECLLELGADVTETDKDDKTCLMWAAEENKAEAITLLLSKSAIQNMIEERDKFNNTALHLASMKGHNDTVKLLLDHRAAADIKNDDDRTTLHMAALHGHDVIIPQLVNRDRSIINAGDEESNTALHLATIGGNLKSVAALIKAGSNLELRNSRQWTPLDCAAAYGWERVVQILLESGASIQPRTKVKKHTHKIAPLQLACQRGHVDVVKILLKWKADVTFRTTDGRNALDFAIDFGQKDCVLALIKHDTWKLSIKNAVINPVTGRLITPMRKLIMKMGDMAMVVCNQCLSDNGKKPEHDEYAVTLAYEFLDDTYSCTEWLESMKAATGQSIDAQADENQYAVYDESDELSPEAYPYASQSDVLQKNHPLQIMVSYESESLLVHPVVTGLLNYKWRRFGRYVYYINLMVFVTFLVVLNSYMLLQPVFFQLDWEKIFDFRNFLNNGRNETGLNTSRELTKTFENDGPDCYYYRADVIDFTQFGAITDQCYTLPQTVRTLKWVIFGFAIFNLFREFLQLLNQKLGYIGFTNLIEVTLYAFSILLTLDFSVFYVDEIAQLTAGNLTESDADALENFQADTGLRQGWQQQIGAFAVFLSWMVLLLFIQKIPRLGIFVVMFTDILKTFSEFFVVFAFFVLAFSLSFTILLGNQHEFERWYEALVKTTVMMIGELDYGTIFYSASDMINDEYSSQVYPRQVSIILFVIFLLVMTIIIMNLLVGLAVGDIIEVQENATLERLGMQVDLALEVEFTLPSFLRKKVCKRKQRIEVNKYRQANFIKRFFFRDSNLSLEKLTQAFEDEEQEQDEPRSAEDKVLSGLNQLRGRLTDLIAEQADLKDDVRGVRTIVRGARQDSKEHAEMIKQDIQASNSRISQSIDSTRSGLTETTQTESNQTRDRVNGTLVVVSELKEDLENTKEGIAVVKSDLEKRMEKLQEEIMSGSWVELETRIQACHDRVDQTKSEIVNALEELKAIVIGETFMTRV